jgi:hypothetical protein
MELNGRSTEKMKNSFTKKRVESKKSQWAIYTFSKNLQFFLGYWRVFHPQME